MTVGRRFFVVRARKIMVLVGTVGLTPADISSMSGYSIHSLMMPQKNSDKKEEETAPVFGGNRTVNCARFYVSWECQSVMVNLLSGPGKSGVARGGRLAHTRASFHENNGSLPPIR